MESYARFSSQHCLLIIQSQIGLFLISALILNIPLAHCDPRDDNIDILMHTLGNFWNCFDDKDDFSMWHNGEQGSCARNNQLSMLSRNDLMMGGCDDLWKFRMESNSLVEMI